MPQFSLNRFINIWFSKPGQPPLGGTLNEYRLISHRLRFPNDELTLVTNLEDFSKNDHEYIQQFCQKHRINLIGLNAIQSEIEKSSLHDKKTQLDLLAIARLEITHECGNLAAASDIIRTLSPVAKCGIYKDFDMIKLKTSNTRIPSPLGLLLDAKFYYDEEEEGLSIEALSNAAFICDESKTSFLKVYRELILARYHRIKETIEKLHQEKVFNIAEYHQARQLMQKEGAAQKSLPLALRFRAALKISSIPESYDIALKQLIMTISGPHCMHAAFCTIMTTEFFPFCENHSLSEQQKLQAFKDLCLISRCPFINEDDASWIPSRDHRQTTWQKAKNAATTIQCMYRMHKAKAIVKQLKSQKKENPLTLHLPH